MIRKINKPTVIIDTLSGETFISNTQPMGGTIKAVPYSSSEYLKTGKETRGLYSTKLYAAKGCRLATPNERNEYFKLVANSYYIDGFKDGLYKCNIKLKTKIRAIKIILTSKNLNEK